MHVLPAATSGGEEARRLNQAWYQVVSLLFGYAGAAIIAVVVLLGARKLAADRALWRRVGRELPRCGAAGTLCVLTAGERRLSAGTELPVPYEGTLGSAHSCDVCIPVRRVHMRSAFFWMEKDALHMVALHRDGFMADGVPVEPGDEAVLRDGAVLCIGEIRLALRLKGRTADREANVGPYVTKARRSKAQQGRGDGLGAPGKGEARRERKIESRTTEKARRTGAAKKG